MMAETLDAKERAEHKRKDDKLRERENDAEMIAYNKRKQQEEAERKKHEDWLKAEHDKEVQRQLDKFERQQLKLDDVDAKRTIRAYHEAEK